MKKILFASLSLFAAAHSACDWPTVNHDPKGSRYNPCEEIISPTNVGTLQVVDQILFNDPSHNTAVVAAPVVVNDVMYFGDTLGRVHAVDFNNFSTVFWTRDLVGPVRAPITVAGDTLYVATKPSNLYALDIATGNIKPGFPVIVDPNNTTATDILAAPVVVDNIVIVPTCGGTPPPFGTNVTPTNHQSISAFNATTGEFIWRRVIQPPPLAPQGGSLSTASVDSDLKLLFIGTSNSASKPVGKLADALLAIDYRDGSLKWHYQFTEDDAWGPIYPNDPDADIITGPTLFHTHVKGKRTAAVGAFSKKGDLKVFDRKNGKLLWKINLLPEGYNYIPFSGPGSAYDSDKHLLYVPTIIDNTLLPYQYQALTILGFNGNTNAASIANGINFGSSETQVSAVDVHSGKVKWQTRLPGGVISGSLATANGVVYASNWTGHVFALDGKTGAILLDTTAIPTGFSLNLTGAPIITNGRLVITSGLGPSTFQGGVIGFGL